jgi:hypothetical protein
MQHENGPFEIPSMTATPKIPDTANNGPVRTGWARFMFWLAFFDLLLFAGLIHRAREEAVSQFELQVLSIGIFTLWPFFAAEAWIGFLRRDRSKPARSALLRALLVTFLPPYRLGTPHPRTCFVWLPRLGWQKPGKALYKRLDTAFSGPMLLFAFLILPVLILEYTLAKQVHSSPTFSLAVHIAVALIWVAFALEFILDSSVAPKPFEHIKKRWLDAAIVTIPLLEFVLTKWVDAAPLARLFRLSRAIAPEQLGRMQQLYRLRGMATKAWQAFLLLGGMGRILGPNYEKRLKQIDEEVANLEDQIAELKQEATEIQSKLAAVAKSASPTGPAAENRLA